jgi:hypothetical protein
MSDFRELALRIFRKVCPGVDPAISMEPQVLEAAFREVGNYDFVKQKCVEFANSGNFPAEGPFTPLYLSIGYTEDHSNPRGFRFELPNKGGTE